MPLLEKITFDCYNGTEYLLINDMSLWYYIGQTTPCTLFKDQPSSQLKRTSLPLFKISSRKDYRLIWTGFKTAVSGETIAITSADKGRTVIIKEITASKVGNMSK